MTILGDAVAPQPAIESFRFYLDAARVGWRFMFFYSLLLAGAAAFVGDKLGGRGGRFIGLGVGMFFATGCLVGELDLVRRLVVMRAVRRRVVGADAILDQDTQRRVAGFGGGTLLIQGAAGLTVALALSLIR